MSDSQRETIDDQTTASSSRLSFASFKKNHPFFVSFSSSTIGLVSVMSSPVFLSTGHMILGVLSALIGIIGLTIVASPIAEYKKTESEKGLDDSVKRYEAFRVQARIASDSDSAGTSPDSKETTIEESQKVSDFEKTVNAMMENNATMTRVFQESTMSDNRSAFRLSAGICIVGLVLLGAVATMTALGLINEGVALVTGVAGAIAELGAGISLVLHQRASAQTSRYYDALHENERVLYSMNMMLQISDDKARDEALSKSAVSLAGGVVGEQESATATNDKG